MSNQLLKKTRRNFVVMFAAIFVGFLLGASFYFYKKHKSADSLASVKGETWDEVKKSYSNNLSTHLSSSTGGAWKKKDFNALMASFGAEKKVRINRDFFQASIYVLDVSPPQWTVEDESSLELLKKKVVSYILDETTESVGEQMQAKSYAARTLVKLGSLPKPELEKLEAQFKNIQSGPRRELILDILLESNPLNKAILAHLTNMASSTSEVGELLMLVPRVRDAESRKSLINTVFKNFSKYSSAVQPAALKFLALNHKLVDGDLNKLVRKASKEQSEVWEDSFLVAVQELDEVAQYRKEILKIKNESRHPHLKNVAESILSREGAVK